MFIQNFFQVIQLPNTEHSVYTLIEASVFFKIPDLINPHHGPGQHQASQLVVYK